MYQAKSILKKKNFVKRTGKRKQAQLILRENKNLLISTHINTHKNIGIRSTMLSNHLLYLLQTAWRWSIKLGPISNHKSGKNHYILTKSVAHDTQF